MAIIKKRQEVLMRMTAGGDVNWCSHCGKQRKQRFLKKLKI